MKVLKLLFPVVMLILSTETLKAEISVADIFTDNMVLQRHTDLKVWGDADPGEQITLSFNGQKLETRANKKGNWIVILSPMAAGGPFEMIIQGKNRIVLGNILIGDVWICSGQSNMGWTVAQSDNADKEIDKGDYPNIRLFSVPHELSSVPKTEMKNTSWKVCTPETIKDFSAVGYFFGRGLHNELDVPIGLINTTWGGTAVETWTSKESIVQLPKYEGFGRRIENFNPEEIEERNRASLEKALGFLPMDEKGLEEGWMNPSTDRSDWKTIEIPNFWENLGYETLDGIVWFSYDFNLETNDIHPRSFLYLGRIDNSDITWINGIKVGEMEWGHEKDREYKIPLDVLKPGLNNITIRVDDRWGKGGFAANQEQFFLKAGKQNIPLNGRWQFKVDKVYDNFKASPNEVPSLLYNAMIHPLIPYGIKGVIWYQGENNTPRAKEYAITFPNMINNWRENWQQGDFPFLFVQLANFQKPKLMPGEDNWAELRESQTSALSLNNTGMALAIDIGEADDIHPTNKQDVGERLKLSALKVAYGKDEVVHSGPKYKSMQIEDGKAVVYFDHIGSGLMVKSKHGYINEFEIAGEDQKFYWAKAKLDGDKVVVWSDKVNKPVSVRFAWSSNPSEFNLYNKEGLPAIPFRTDDWEGLTNGKSFDD